MHLTKVAALFWTLIFVFLVYFCHIAMDTVVTVLQRKQHRLRIFSGQTVSVSKIEFVYYLKCRSVDSVLF